MVKRPQQAKRSTPKALAKAQKEQFPVAPPVAPVSGPAPGQPIASGQSMAPGHPVAPAQQAAAPNAAPGQQAVPVQHVAPAQNSVAGGPKEGQRAAGIPSAMRSETSTSLGRFTAEFATRDQVNDEGGASRAHTGRASRIRSDRSSRSSFRTSAQTDVGGRPRKNRTQRVTTVQDFVRPDLHKNEAFGSIRPPVNDQYIEAPGFTMPKPRRRTIKERLTRQGRAKVYRLKGYTSVGAVRRNARREEMKHQRRRWRIGIVVVVLLIILIAWWNPFNKFTEFFRAIGL